MGTVVVLDGEAFEPEDARISVFDHGFLFGDSVYEVVRTRHGRPFLLDPHLARLRSSAEELYLEVPYTDDALREEVRHALELAGNGESYVRIILTRGVGELDLHPRSCEKPTLILIAGPLKVPPESAYRTGIRLAIVGRRRHDPLALSPTAKTGNYLNNVLAIVEARRRGADDAVMLNADGYLTEGTTANVFFVKDGVVRTPELLSGILEGITRGLVIKLLAGEGISCVEGLYTGDDLRAADEAFITSTTRDVMPVREVDDAAIGTGCPGPTAVLLRRLIAAL
jgi:branched-chain amino acid aminotransferase